MPAVTVTAPRIDTRDMWREWAQSSEWANAKVKDELAETYDIWENKMAAVYASAEAKEAELFANAMDEQDKFLGMSLEQRRQWLQDNKAITESVSDDIKNAMTGWASTWSSTLTDMVWEADTSFNSILESFGKMLTQMVMQKMIVEPFISWMGTAFEHGGVIQAYGGGGVISKPTIFPMQHGYGLAGEKGAEAIMPLTRLPGGDLGVKAEGGGSNVEIHVHNYGESQVDVKESQTRQGSIRIDVLIDDVVSQKLQDGKSAKVLKDYYGIAPAVTGR
jgi:phage-related minor tail protein